MELFMTFHSVGNVIIPTDSYFSEVFKPPTRKWIDDHPPILLCNLSFDRTDCSMFYGCFLAEIDTFMGIWNGTFSHQNRVVSNVYCSGYGCDLKPSSLSGDFIGIWSQDENMRKILIMGCRTNNVGVCVHGGSRIIQNSHVQNAPV